MESKSLRPRPYFPSPAMRKPMVGWMRPDVLVSTLVDLFRSWIVETQIDTRELQSHVPEGDPSRGEAPLLIEYDWKGRVTKGRRRSSRVTKSTEPFYFDYIADTADGWDSTYSVAHLLSRDRLRISIKEGDAQSLLLPRGRFLVIGGDAVYPSASDTEYRNRLVRPFSYAWDWCWRDESSQAKKTSDERRWGYYPDPVPSRAPYIYAIPGNHDWYDCLSSFRRRFCNTKNPRSIGKWKTDQSRSYFALRLPADWYILALDIGLDCNLDNSQYNYFMEITKQMRAGSRILLLVAEPLWVSGGIQNNKLYRLLESFEDKITEMFISKRQEPPQIRLYLAGDTHCYERYERKSLQEIETELRASSSGRAVASEILSELRGKYHKKQSIVCGGGGAFLHPSHGKVAHNQERIPSRRFRKGREQDENRIELPIADSFAHKSSYPDEKTSRSLAWRLARRFVLNRDNWWLAFLIGLGHTLLSAPTALLIRKHTALTSLPELFLSHPVLFVSSVVGSCVLVGIYARLPALGTPSYPKKTHWAGWLWGILQTVTAVFIQLSCLMLPEALFSGLSAWPDTSFLLGLGCTILANALMGGLIYAHGLAFLSVFWGLSHNDAFAHGAVPGYKSFLRFEIRPEDGSLRVYPIAVPRPVTYAIPGEEEIDAAAWQQQALLPDKQAYTHPSGTPIEAESLPCHLIEEPVEL